MFFEIAHDSTGRTEAEGASSRQKDGIHFIYHLQRMQHIGFMGRWSASANINAANSGPKRAKNCTPRSCLPDCSAFPPDIKRTSDVDLLIQTTALLILVPFFPTIL